MRKQDFAAQATGQQYSRHPTNTVQRSRNMNKTMIGTAAALLVFGASIATLQAQAPSRTVWDGVFSADQAAAGKTLYEAKCAMCHGPDLAGAEMAPALAGGSFMADWAGQSVGDLATRIHTTMPANDPGSLSDKQVADAVAYILLANQFPAGGTALASDASVQGQINIVADKPAGK
jgi:mono/diheme cytochrome c family protein